MAERKTKRARRGRGEGCIYQRPDGRWVAYVTVGYDETGKRRRKVVYGTTKREAADKLARLQQKRVNGDLDDSARMTVSTFLASWLENAAKPRLRESTYATYEVAIRLHINPQIGGVTLAKLTPLHVRGILSKMAESKRKHGGEYGPRRQQYALKVLARALKQAVKWGMLTRNVCDAVESPRVPKHEIKPLDGTQAVAFLKAVEASPIKALFVLAIDAGMRQGEILALQWDDVDLRAGTLSVRRTLHQKKGRQFSTSEPKTAKGRRLIDLTGIALEALQEHRVQALAAGRMGFPWVFCDAKGNNLTRNVVNGEFHRLRKAAGVPRIRFHDLRHTSASLLLSAGVHPKVVQERLGHSQIAITLDTYSHVMPGMQREAARKMQGLLIGHTVATLSPETAVGG